MPGIAIRVDASARNPPWRLRRSLALAAGLRDTDPSSEITFLLSGHKSCAQAVGRSGFPCRYMGPGGITYWDQEASGDALKGTGASILVVDEHGIDEGYIKAMGEEAFLVVMDDFVHLRRYDAHVLVNPNINAHLIDYQCAEGTELLLGTEFTPLPPEFDQYQEMGRVNPERARRIFVDGQGKSALPAVRALRCIEDRFHAEVLVGPDFQQGEELAREIGLDQRFVVISDDCGRAKRMSAADMALTSPCTAFHELMLGGMPCALISESAGEAVLAEYASRNNFAVSLGDASGLDAQQSAQILQRLMHDKAARDRMSARTAELVDGMGRFRLADELLKIYGKRK
jgi:spore coat polysaccharide biosynthesis predicted glycosyltransferase SpsG